MISLCTTCKHFMLVKIKFIGRNDITKKDCLIKPNIFNDLKVGRYRDDKGVRGDAPNVIYCTHYDMKEDSPDKSVKLPS